MSNIQKFIKSTGIYFIGNVLTKVISFFLLPLYTNYIPTDGMGYYEQANAYLNIIVPVICVAIWSAILRFIFDYDDLSGKYKVIFNAMVVFTGSFLLYLLGSVILGSIKEIRDLPLIFIMGVAMMLHSCYTNITRGLGYNAIFAFSGIVGGLVNCVTNIILILVFHMDESSLFISLALGLFVQIVMMECKVHLLKHLSFRLFDKELMVTMLKYSAPLAVNSACYWFLTGYIRIGITNNLGLDANGIYAVAGKFSTVIGLISNCFSLAMQELLYSLGNKKENKEQFYTSVSNYYIKFLMFGLILLLPVIEVVFPFFIKGDYVAAFPLIPFNLLSTVASIYGVFLGDVFAAEKQTRSLFYTTVAAAAVNVSAFHILVGYFGLQAANIALCAGFFTIIIARILLLRKFFTIKLDYKMVLTTTLLFIATFIIYLTQGVLVNIIVFIVLFAITCFAFRDLLRNLYAKLKSKVQAQTK